MVAGTKKRELGWFQGSHQQDCKAICLMMVKDPERGT